MLRVPISTTHAFPLAHPPAFSPNSRPLPSPANPTPFYSGCAQPSYKETRANQLRVRSPEWRAPERPDFQKSQIPPSRYPPTWLPALPISTKRVSPFQSPVQVEKQPARNRFPACLDRVKRKIRSDANE